MKLFEKVMEKNYIYKGKILNLRKDLVMLPNGNKSVREVIEHRGGVCILALDDENNCYFVEQYRYPFEKVILEAPAGKIDADEIPLNCAKRELKEETGLIAEKFISLGCIYPSTGYTDEIIYLYLAKNLTQEDMSPDEDEFLNVIKIPFTHVIDMITNNKICDAKTVAAVLKAKQLLY